MGDIADDHQGYIFDELERGFINEYGLYETYDDPDFPYMFIPRTVEKPLFSCTCKFCSAPIRFDNRVAYDSNGKHLCLRQKACGKEGGNE